MLVGALSPVSHYYIRAEGDLHKNYSSKDKEAEIRLEEQLESGELLREFVEGNTVERAVKTETDKRNE